jgi:hypothetical protein
LKEIYRQGGGYVSWIARGLYLHTNLAAVPCQYISRALSSTNVIYTHVEIDVS